MFIRVYVSHWSSYWLQLAAIFVITLVISIRTQPVMAAQLAAGVFHLDAFTYTDANGREQGLLVDSMALLKDQGHSFRYRQIPHGRLFYELMQGSIDLALVLVMPDDLELPAVDSIAITQYPLLRVPLNLYALSDPLQEVNYPDEISTISDLVGLKVGIFRASASETYTVLKHNDNVVFFNRYKSAIKSLLSGRIDLLAIDPLSAAYWEKMLSVQLDKKYYLASISVHVAFSVTSLGDDALGLCESLWRSLIEKANDDQLEGIYLQYRETPLMAMFNDFSSRQDHYCHTMKH